MRVARGVGAVDVRETDAGGCTGEEVVAMTTGGTATR
jgi:hypothetical protein